MHSWTYQNTFCNLRTFMIFYKMLMVNQYFKSVNGKNLQSNLQCGLRIWPEKERFINLFPFFGAEATPYLAPLCSRVNMDESA